MEHLSVNKNWLIIHNYASSEIEISLDDKDEIIIIKANSLSEVLVHSNSVILTVKEYDGENSESLKFSEILLGFIVSVPLLLINCLHFETVDKSIELPVKFKLLCSNSENEIVISNSEEPLKGYSLSFNNKAVSGEIVYSQIETERQIKEYYKSFAVSLIFPIIFFVTFIIVSLYLKNTLSLLVFLIAFILFSICILKILRKNKKIIKNIINKVLHN